MNNYKLLGRAGEGAHGFVFKGIDLRTNEMVALKKISFNPDLGIPKNIMREICSLRALKSKHIVELIEVTSMGSAVVLVMEFLPCSLADILKNKNSNFLNFPQIKTYAHMIFTGIDFIHQHKIMHRDIKPPNLLINHRGQLKIADFGLARIYNPNKNRLYSHQVATRWYRAPELLYGSKTYSLSVDMWAVGCILVEMINKKPLFPGETDIEQLAIVLGTLGSPTNETWPDLENLPDYNKIAFTPSEGKSWSSIISNADDETVNLISKILIYDGSLRMSAENALKHNFFQVQPEMASLDDMPKPNDIIVEEEPMWNFEEFDEIFNLLN